MNIYTLTIQDKKYGNLIDVLNFKTFEAALEYCKNDIKESNKHIFDEFGYGIYFIVTDKYDYEIHTTILQDS